MSGKAQPAYFHFHRISDTRSGKASDYDHVARLAAVRPAAGERLKGVSSVDKAVARWRRTLRALYAVGLPDVLRSRRRWLSCINCRPCGYAVGRDSLACYQAGFCPFCYGRKTQRVFGCVLNAMSGFSADVLPDYTLAGVVHDLPISLDDSLRGDFIHAIRNGLKWRRSVVTLFQPVGAYFSFLLSPRREPGCWTAHCRAVLLLGPFSRASQLAGFEEARGFNHVLTYRPAAGRPISRRKIARLVGQTLSYPRPLLTGDPKRLRGWIDARARHRLTASVGLFRKSHAGSKAG